MQLRKSRETDKNKVLDSLTKRKAKLKQNLDSCMNSSNYKGNTNP